MNPPADYRPSAYYFRQDIEEARTKKELRETARALVLELEFHKEWIRERGLVPPKFIIPQRERLAKNLRDEVIPFPAAAAAEKGS